MGYCAIHCFTLLCSALFCFHLILSRQSFCRAVCPSHTSHPSPPLCSQTQRSSSLPEPRANTNAKTQYNVCNRQRHKKDNSKITNIRHKSMQKPHSKYIRQHPHAWKEQLNGTESGRDKIWYFFTVQLQSFRSINESSTVSLKVLPSCLAPRASSSSSEAAAHAFFGIESKHIRTYRKEHIYPEWLKETRKATKKHFDLSL